MKRFNKLKKDYKLFREKNAVIFDRDGTIISEKKFVNSPKKIKIFNNFYKTINKIKKDFILICITNQSGISKGFITEKKLEKIHLELNKKIYRKTGTFFDKFYYCPHYPVAGFKKEIKKIKNNLQMQKTKARIVFKSH